MTYDISYEKPPLLQEITTSHYRKVTFTYQNKANEKVSYSHEIFRVLKKNTAFKGTTAKMKKVSSSREETSAENEKVPFSL